MKTITLVAFLPFTCCLTVSAQILPINGQLDSTFGTNGIAIFSDPNSDIEPYAVEFGSDGKYYVAGNFGFGPNKDAVIARFMGNGALDSSFGVHGKIFFDPLLGGIEDVRDLKLDANNRIVVVGGTWGNDWQHFVARFLPDGAFDTTFNHNGLVVGGAAFDDHWSGCTVEPNGDILVVGALSDGSGSNKAMIKYKSNGTLDPAFGFNGTQVLDESNSESFKTIYRKSSNEYYLIGQTNGIDILYSYDGTGNLRASFGNNGKFNFTPPVGLRTYVLDLAIEGNDLFLAGYYRDLQTNKTDLLVGKMNQMGVLSPSFGSNGYYSADFGAGESDYASDLKILDDGSIFLVGSIYAGFDSATTNSYLLASDGSLYSSYGTNGTMQYPLSTSETAFGIDITEDDLGRVTILVWNVIAGGQTEAALLRLKTLPSNFGLTPFTSIAANCRLYPNPASNQLHLSLDAVPSERLEITLYDLHGAAIGQMNAIANEGTNIFDLHSLLPALADGVYLVHVRSERGLLHVQRLLKH